MEQASTAKKVLESAKHLIPVTDILPAAHSGSNATSEAT
jgi:hypothetical protein